MPIIQSRVDGDAVGGGRLVAVPSSCEMRKSNIEFSHFLNALIIHSSSVRYCCSFTSQSISFFFSLSLREEREEKNVFGQITKPGKTTAAFVRTEKSPDSFESDRKPVVLYVCKGPR